MKSENTSLTILTKDQAAIVDEVKTYHAGVRKSYEHQVQYAFMAGLKLTALKDSCLHGNAKDAKGEGFRALCASEMPELSRSVITRYLDFTHLLSEKMPTVGIIQNRVLLLKNGELPEKEKEAVLKAVYEAADGKSWTAFYRDLNLVRKAQPHVHHPIKPLSPDEKVAAENEQAAALVNAAIFALQVLLTDLHSKTGNLALRVPVKLWKDILRTTTQFNKMVRPLSKRKLSPAEKKQETQAKAKALLSAVESCQATLNAGKITPEAKAALNAAAQARWDKVREAGAKFTNAPLQ